MSCIMFLFFLSSRRVYLLFFPRTYIWRFPFGAVSFFLSPPPFLSQGSAAAYSVIARILSIVPLIPSVFTVCLPPWPDAQPFNKTYATHLFFPRSSFHQFDGRRSLLARPSSSHTSKQTQFPPSPISPLSAFSDVLFLRSEDTSNRPDSQGEHPSFLTPPFVCLSPEFVTSRRAPPSDAPIPPFYLVFKSVYTNPVVHHLERKDLSEVTVAIRCAAPLFCPVSSWLNLFTTSTSPPLFFLLLSSVRV